MPIVQTTVTGARPSLDDARRVLKTVWGYPGFRFPQQRVIAGVINGRDVLALLPTGGGKSLCFQVPALTLGGTTLVVSPLISLMQDQVTAVRNRGVRAAFLSSAQSGEQRRDVWSQLRAGALQMLYVAPERLGQIVERCPDVPISLLAVDEAHCISEWGHDFRPHYRSIGRHRKALGWPPTIAVTATATKATQDDIAHSLGLRRPVRVLTTFDRPNLLFQVQRFADDAARLRHCIQAIRKHGGTSIVYVPTRNRTDDVATVLRQFGFRASPYHAALPNEARHDLLTRFLAGEITVMVATNAFGMGIDYPDVRSVIHLGVPTRPEAYYQEAGRAGRDGQVAWCYLSWTMQDLAIANGMAGTRAKPTDPRARAIWSVRKAGMDAMKSYVFTRRCRRKHLLRYFGEHLPRCAGCDRCGLPGRNG